MLSNKCSIKKPSEFRLPGNVQQSIEIYKYFNLLRNTMQTLIFVVVDCSHSYRFSSIGCIIWCGSIFIFDPEKTKQNNKRKRTGSVQPGDEFHLKNILLIKHLSRLTVLSGPFWHVPCTDWNSKEITEPPQYSIRKQVVRESLLRNEHKYFFALIFRLITLNSWLCEGAFLIRDVFA